MGKGGLVVLLSLSSWCPMIVLRLFLAVPSVCLQFVIVVFPDHTHLLFLTNTEAPIETASANSAKFRGIRPRMYIDDLL